MKKWLYIAGAALLLLGIISYQHNRLKNIRAENLILNSNVEVLTGDNEMYRVNDSLQAVSVRELSLKLSDYERYRTEDMDLISELRMDKKRLESIVTVQQQTIREVQVPVEPLIIVREDNRRDTVMQVSYSDQWLDFRVWQDPPDSMNVEIQCRDSLMVVQHIIPKRFLGFLWKTRRAKERRIEVVSKNPHTEIIGSEFITIRD